MNFNPVKPDVIKYEMRTVSGENPMAQQQKRPGAFGRFLSGVGRFFGSVAAPLSLIFPPAAIGAAGMYGVGSIGDQMQYRAYQKQVDQQSSPQYISYPGMDMEPAAGGVVTSKAPGFQASLKDEAVMDILFARNDMMTESAQKI